LVSVALAIVAPSAALGAAVGVLETVAPVPFFMSSLGGSAPRCPPG
jgi:hypothetical protein